MLSWLCLLNTLKGFVERCVSGRDSPVSSSRERPRSLESKHLSWPPFSASMLIHLVFRISGGSTILCTKSGSCLRWVLLCLHCVDISLLTLLQLIVVYFCFTETRGATLEEISQLFDGKDAAEALKLAAAERSEKAMVTQTEVTQGETKDNRDINTSGGSR